MWKICCAGCGHKDSTATPALTLVLVTMFLPVNSEARGHPLLTSHSHHFLGMTWFLSPLDTEGKAHGLRVSFKHLPLSALHTPWDAAPGTSSCPVPDKGSRNQAGDSSAPLSISGWLSYRPWSKKDPGAKRGLPSLWEVCLTQLAF